MPMAVDAEEQPPSLEEFSKRLDAAHRDPKLEVKPAVSGAALGRALRLSTELLAAILVGTALGWGLDRLTGLSPWFLLAGIGFGFAAGVRNIWRAMLKENSSGNG